MAARTSGLWFLAVALFASVPASAQMTLPYASTYGSMVDVDPATGEVYVVKVVRPQFSPVPPTTDGTSIPAGEDMGWWIAKVDPSRTCAEPHPGEESLCWASFPLTATGPIPTKAMTLGPNGDLYVTGYDGEPGLATPGAYNEVDPGGRPVWVARFSGVDGSLIAFTYLNQVNEGNSNPSAIHVASNGWVIVTGWTGQDIPYTSNAYSTSLAGSVDAFVAILNEDLSNQGGASGDGLIYGSLLPGGSAWDEGLAVTADGFGRVWVGGYSSSGDFDTGPFQGGYSSTFQGGTDGFLLEIDPVAPSASIVWGTLFGGSDDDDVAGLAIDGAGNILVAGSTASSGLALQRSLRGGLDAYVASFAPGGASLVDGTYLGGKGTDLGVAVRIDGNGNIITAGSTASRNFPTLNAYDSTHNSRNKDDVFVTRLDGTFAITDSTFLGGGSHDTCLALHLDANGSAYVSGAPTSSDFPFTVTTFGFGAFLAKLDFGSGPPPGDVTVTSSAPDTMMAGTTLSVTITGTGFAPGATVTFENGTGPTPTASNVVWQDPNTLTADVSVGGGGRPGPRLWDVRVTNQDSSTGALPAGFTVVK